MKKRILSLLTTLIMLCGFTSIIPTISVSARENRTSNFNKSYSLGNNAGQNMVNIAKAQIGRNGGQFGYTEEWCADFVMDCAILANQTQAIPNVAANANCGNMLNSIKNAGGREISVGEAVAGDILFYTNNGRISHVEIVYGKTGSTLSSLSTIGGNSGNKNNSLSMVKDHKTQSGMNPYKLLRPNYSGSDDAPVDLGTDFYAFIINTNVWKDLTNDSDNVSFRTETGESKQIWKFDRQSDGSYKIKNCYDGKLLDVQGASSDSGTNVSICADNGSSAQKWYIYGKSAEYIFKPGCSDCVLDMNSGKFHEGVNAQIWTKNNGNAQKMQIWKLDKPNLPAATPKVQTYGDEKGNNVKITWNACENATGYDIRIYDEKGENVLYTYWNVQGTSYITKIPAGNYQVGICSLNNKFNFWTGGKMVSFTAVNNLGDDFYAFIINTDAWKDLTNDSDNVSFRTETGESKQIWNFKLQNDGSYKIKNCSDGKLLDVQGASSDSGTNVSICADNGSSAQKWYIYGKSAEYIFKPDCSDCVLDMNSGKFYEGVNAQIWTKNNGKAQRMQIWKLDKPNLPAATPKVEAYSDSKGNNIKITWNACENATGYDIRIYDSKGEKTLYTYWNVQNTSYITKLPAGNYQVGICSLNNKFNFWTGGKIVSFTAKDIPITTTTTTKISTKPITTTKSTCSSGITTKLNINTTKPTGTTTKPKNTTTKPTGTTTKSKNTTTKSTTTTIQITVTTTKTKVTTAQSTVTTQATSTSVTPVKTNADLNGDGKINTADIVEFQKIALKKYKNISYIVDLNGDGAMNVYDMIILKRTVLAKSQNHK